MLGTGGPQLLLGLGRRGSVRPEGQEPRIGWRFSWWIIEELNLVW